MTVRLGEYVVYGELHNHRHYSTHGFLVLRTPLDAEQYVMHLELTGDCQPDLKGKIVRFQIPEPEAEGPLFVEEEHRGLQYRQIGPTGHITAADWARVLPCSAEEYYQRCKLGEPPPTPWKRRLCLEWFGQNGRVCIEVADPLMEERVRAPEGPEDEGEWRTLTNPAPCPEDLAQPAPPPMPEFMIIRNEEEGVPIQPWRPLGDEADDGEEDEGEGLPRELQHALDAEAFAVDMAVRGEEPLDKDDPLYEMKMLDYCIDHVQGEPIASLVHEVEKLPPADTLSDEEAETRLKDLLLQLAVRNIALSLCAHATPRDAYRYLVEVILPGCTYYQEMVGTGFVQQFYTGDDCPLCEEEAMKDYPDFEKYQEEQRDERSRGGEEKGEYSGGEDCPF